MAAISALPTFQARNQDVETSIPAKSRKCISHTMIEISGKQPKSKILMQRIVNRGDKEGGDGPESSLRPASFASYLG